MKTLPSILACLLLAACSACTSIPAPPPAPDPPVIQPSSGVYFITEYDVDGKLKHMWTVEKYTETQFPRSVTFEAEGKTITLKGSYQIDSEYP